MKDSCYIIAEIGVNHNGSVDLACQMIDAAAAAGADAVKFQTFRAEDLVTSSASQAEYQKANTQSDQSQFAMLKSLELSEAEFVALKNHCVKQGVEFLSTPFSEDAVDLLMRVGVSAFKVSSGDLTHLPLLRHIGRQGLPVILSTGMGTLAEIEQALEAVSLGSDVEVSLLHCVSNYPAAPEECNLAAMDTMRQAFGLRTGWSDHTVGSAISWAAVARGASIIEKHITISCSLPGPDHKASMEPSAFSEFVSGIRAIEAAIGSGRKAPNASEIRIARDARRSVVSRRALTKGSILKETDVKIVRPGYGIPPSSLPLLLGCRLGRDVASDTPISKEDLHGG